MAKLSSTHIYGDLYVDGTISGALSGNASTATTLQTARTINGTSFNGSANITTANWGTARTITIGNTGKSVNGSGNVSWTLAEIGAAASSHGTHLTLGTGASNAAAGNHTHSYLPLSGGTLTGNVTLQHGTASKEAQYVAKRTDTGVGVFMGVGSGGENHGVYSQKLDKWMVYADTSNVHLNGNAATATKLATTRAIKIGNKSINFDGSAAITYTLSDIGAAAASHGTHLTIGTGASNAAAGNHTHNYAGSSSAGGAANSVKTNLIIKLNGGSTEGTNLFTFNGGTAKTVNITPSAIGAAASSHGTHLSLGTTSSTAYRGDYGNTAYKHSQAAHAPSNAQKNSDITKAEIEAKLTGNITSHTHSAYAAASHGTHVRSSAITTGYDTTFRTKTKGDANSGSYFSTVRTDTASVNYAPQYGSGIAWGQGDTHGYLNVSYSSAIAYLGGGSSDKLNWVKQIAFSDHNHDSTYAKVSHGTHLTIGTGASNAAAGNHTHSGYASSSHSHDFFNVKGDNTINSTSNDNTTNWGNHGNSVHFYTATGQLIDQPNQWGFLLNIGRTSEVHQIWMTQASGDMYHRGGNASGWSGSWRKLLDSSNWSSYAAPSSHNHTQLTGEVRFPGSGSYTDPWSGITCAIKATGNVGLTGTLRANAGIYSTSGNGVATADGSTYAALLRYKDSRGYCDLGNNTIPGRLYIRSGQGTAGSGVLVECAVTNGNAYMQYLSPEAGTIALTRHLSDRTRKDNIVYVDSKDSEFTNKDFYDFIKNDLGLATYNLKKEYASTDTHTKLNFIAQDILWDFEKNEENKVGNLIVQAEDAMDQQLSLKYDPEVFTSVIAGALKESINKIEELEDKNKKLEERLAMLEEKFSVLENK